MKRDEFWAYFFLTVIGITILVFGATWAIMYSTEANAVKHHCLSKGYPDTSRALGEWFCIRLPDAVVPLKELEGE